jgi:ferredoxin
VGALPLPRIIEKIHKRKCPAQRDICKAIAACPRGAISYVEEAQEPLGGKIFFDYDKCDVCGQCVTECCGAAIEMW